VKLTSRRRHPAAAAGLPAAALLAAGVTLGACGSSPQAPPPARQYTAQAACLLTGPGGITATPASTVWAGMQDASRATHAKVTYLAVNGPATTSAVPYANALIEQHCNVVLAAGAPETSALTQIAPRTPKTYFVIVGNITAFATANLKTIGLTPDTRSQVDQTVQALVNALPASVEGLSDFWFRGHGVAPIAARWRISSGHRRRQFHRSPNTPSVVGFLGALRG
jgi:hypothetical protein